MTSITKNHCCLNKQRILRRNCGNQGNSFPKQDLTLQRFLWGYINPQMDCITLDILLKVVNYNIHEKFRLWRYPFHGRLLHAPMCVYLTGSSMEGRTWIKDIAVLSFYGHKVCYFIYNFLFQSGFFSKNWEKDNKSVFVVVVILIFFFLFFFCKEFFLTSCWFVFSVRRIKW